MDEGPWDYAAERKKIDDRRHQFLMDEWRELREEEARHNAICADIEREFHRRDEAREAFGQALDRFMRRLFG